MTTWWKPVEGADEQTERRLHRLLARATLDAATGCWLWQGAKQSRGYGSVGDGKGSSALAHRVSWELHNGGIPPGLTVDHRCHTKSCINPAHLELVPAALNSARGNGMSPLYCVNGHPMFGRLGGWVRRENGKRRCRLCAAETGRAWRKRTAAPERAAS